MTYDKLNRIDGITLTNSQNESLTSFTYSYDAVNEIAAEVRDGGESKFSYDRARQLTNSSVLFFETNALVSGFAYSYDNCGNRIKSIQKFLTNSYQVNDINEYTMIKNETNQLALAYDANGNLTNQLGRTLYYDNNNLLSEWTAGGTSGKIVRDGLGRPVAMLITSNGVDTVAQCYIYDGSLAISIGTDKNGWLQFARGLDISGSRTFAAGIGGLLAETADGNSRFYSADASGNVCIILDSSGSVIHKEHYGPYGELTELNSPDRFLFASQENISGASLVNFLYRSYDPNLGRWGSRDPAQDNFTPNGYVYANNSPYVYFDVLGLSCEEVNCHEISIEVGKDYDIRVGVGFGFSGELSYKRCDCCSGGTSSEVNISGKASIGLGLDVFGIGVKGPEFGPVVEGEREKKCGEEKPDTDISFGTYINIGGEIDLKIFKYSYNFAGTAKDVVTIGDHEITITGRIEGEFREEKEFSFPFGEHHGVDYGGHYNPPPLPSLLPESKPIDKTFGPITLWSY